MFVRVRLVIQKCIACCNSFRNSEASEQEMQEYFAKCEIERQLEQQESERNFQEYLAQRKAEEEELERRYWDAYEKRLKDSDADQREREYERREREMGAKQAEEEHYRSHCPTCGSRRSTWNSRCRVCDEAFGH